MNKVYYQLTKGSNLLTLPTLNIGDEFILSCSDIESFTLIANKYKLIDMSVRDYIRIMTARKIDRIFSSDLFTLKVERNKIIESIQLLEMDIVSLRDGGVIFYFDDLG